MRTFASLPKYANICKYIKIYAGTQELPVLYQLKVITKISKTLELMDPCSFTHLLQLISQLGKPKPREGSTCPRTHKKLPFEGAVYLRTKLQSQKELVLIPGISPTSYNL